MKTFVLLGILAVNAAAVSAADSRSTNGAAAVAGPLVEVSGGTVTFEVATNVPAVSVHGESEALQGRVRVRQSPSGVALEELEAIVPVHSLKTGIAVRDEHSPSFAKGQGHYFHSSPQSKDQASPHPYGGGAGSRASRATRGGGPTAPSSVGISARQMWITYRG